MDVWEALYTTRAMRRVRTDPIPLAVQERILDAAVRAPSGGNTQDWRFLLVDDPAVKARLAPLYADSIRQLWETAYRPRLEAARANPSDPASVAFLKVQASAQWLADHFADVPLFLFAFSHDSSGGSIFPAVWSAQLAARAQGVGSAGRRSWATSTRPRRWRSWACPRARAGRWPAACRSGIRPGGGAWRPGVPLMRSPTGTPGAPIRAWLPLGRSGRTHTFPEPASRAPPARPTTG
jgi:nitroreductase